MTIPSPCISVCVTDPDSDLCYGCARTTPEIAKWSKYTDEEKKVIKRALMSLYSVNEVDAEKVLLSAEIKEQGSNQIIEFTKEIKKNNIEFRLKIIEILWQIVYSDGTNDMYESNLIRRVCGLLYISDKDNGSIKLKVKNSVINE